MLREEPLNVVQAALEVKNLFGGLGNSDLQACSFTGGEFRFVKLGGGGGALLFVKGGSKTNPEVLSDQQTVLLRTIQIELANGDFLPRGKCRREGSACRRLLKRQRGRQNFPKKISTFTEFMGRRKALLGKPDPGCRVDQ